jgi:hypothetical protein
MAPRADAPSPRRGADVGVVAALCTAAAALVAADGSLGDYVPGAWAGGNAAPGIHALIAGDVGRYFALQPVMGLGSIAWRLPFAGLAEALGGGATAVYRAGALACLAGPVALGAYLFHRMRAAGRPALERWLVAGLCVLNPMTWDALRSGHPEEALAAALAVGAVLAAGERPLLSGALVGLAIGTKQWALVALPLVVIAAPRRRIELLIAAIAVAACLLVPGPLANGSAARAARDSVARGHATNELSGWWPLADTRVGPAGTTLHVLPRGLDRGEVTPLVPLVALLLGLALWRRRDGDGAASAEQALAVLAIALIARCALDPLNQWYYETGALLSVCAWEALARRRLPLVSLLAAAAGWAVFRSVAGHGDHALTNAAFLALSGLLAAYLGAAAFAPRLLAPAGALAPEQVSGASRA